MCFVQEGFPGVLEQFCSLKTSSVYSGDLHESGMMFYRLVRLGHCSSILATSQLTHLLDVTLKSCKTEKSS